MKNEMTVKEYQDALKAQNIEGGITKAVVICPHCKTGQTAQDFIDAGVGDDFDEVQSRWGFSCIGRFKDGVGCDWTLGGLLQIHEIEVIGPDGNKYPRFKPATPEQAKRYYEEKDDNTISGA